MIIAVDGPAGSGKSTISKIIAEKLNLIYLDTGAMYRACAYLKLYDYKDCSDEEFYTNLKNTSFKFEDNGKMLKLVLINDKIIDVTEIIRSNEISKHVSTTSADIKIREIMTKKQINFGNKHQKVILDGRDIGTIVFPNADLKLFLIATPEKRAERRYNELLKTTQNIDYNVVLKELEKRDNDDMNRSIAPLKKADGAIELDTSNMNIDEVVSFIIEKANSLSL